jgi:hypothetical protein
LKLPIIGILSGVALATLGLSGIAEAAILLPSLPPGSQYRLVFVTSGTVPGSSTDINSYNSFVNTAAQSSALLNTALTAAGFNPSSINWTAIASTSAVNARVNTQTQATDTSRPIYLLDGVLVATSYTDLWDGSIAAPLNVSQSGNTLTNPSESLLAWTGTNANGSTLTALGQGAGRVGSISATDSGWVSQTDFSAASTFVNRLYAISDVLTTAAPTATTPEPSSLLGFITLGGLMLGGVARKVRK